MSYDFLLTIAIIMLFTKVFGLTSERVHMPQVVGALIAGVLVGPSCLGWVGETDFLVKAAEIGVIILMFNAGMDTDLDELKTTGFASFIIALIGVIVPLIGGVACYLAFDNDPTDPMNMLKAAFIGVVLTATSVSITVETLREMGKLKSKVGTAILGAAVIDDILGIIALTLITSVSDPSVNIVAVLVKIVAFFALSLAVGVLLHKLIEKWMTGHDDKRRYAVISFAFCLLYSFFAEAVFGVADITGAYIAGLIFANTCRVAYLQDRFDTLSYSLLSPIFFASIGLKVVLPEMSTTILLFAVLLVLWAVVSKVVGCGLGAKLCRYSNQDALRIGVGMISRGEVALIVAQKGLEVGVVEPVYFTAVILLIVVSSVATPLALKALFTKMPPVPHPSEAKK